MRKLILLLLLTVNYLVFGQELFRVTGRIVSKSGVPVPGVFIKLDGTQSTSISDIDGKFSLRAPSIGEYSILTSHIEFKTTKTTILIERSHQQIEIILEPQVRVLKQVEISDGKTIEKDLNAAEFKVQMKTISDIPSPFKDISRLIVTLPGVNATNELSSTYSVRGGNFDENLIYINDMPVYRPFLIRAGRQEGLSFVNPDLVQGLSFSAGGWRAELGDRLSSVLEVDYKEPDEFHSSLSVGLITGSFHVEGSSRDRRLTYLAGYRHKDSRYLLNTLETQGQYLPTFDDFQGMVTYDFSPLKNKRTTIDLFSLYARNRYLTIPESRTSEFGNFQRSFRLFVGFDGKETLDYDTYQGGLSLKHRWNSRLQSKLINTYIRSLEVENIDLESGYRLCDVDKNSGSDRFNECAVVRGIGTLYDNGRNGLEVEFLGTELKNELIVNDLNEVEFGIGFRMEKIEDRLDEFSFMDSADFVIFDRAGLGKRKNNIKLNNGRLQGYVQHNVTSRDSLRKFTYGLRFHKWSLNNQMLLSPRVQYQSRLRNNKNWSFKVASGLYHQPPIYRELRDRLGNQNFGVQAQSSAHLLIGADHYFQMWGREFKFFMEGYLKYYYDLNPYDIDNVKIRYFAVNNARAFATGADFRVNGQFIEGAESWFSFSVMHAREDITGDGKKFIRRPSDQRLNMSIFFQDHMPNNPLVRVNLNLNFGSGLPFGPPLADSLRNRYSGDIYMRADAGFAKIIELKGNAPLDLDNIVIGADLLNIFGTENAISYIWIEDVVGQTFAVPNTLSARFLNIKITFNR